MIYDIPALRARLATAFPGIDPCHEPLGHRYLNRDTQKKAWSVTTKLAFVSKGYLPKWYAKRSVEYIREHLSRLLDGDLSVLDEAAGAGEESRDSSASIGTTAHGAIDSYLNEWIKQNRRSPISATSFLADGSRGEEIAACRSFDRFLDEQEIIPLASEIRVWYETVRGNDSFAGTVDAIFLWLNPHKGRVGEHGVITLDGSIHSHDYEVQPSGIFWCSACNRECKATLVLGDHKTSNNIKGKDDYAQQDTAYAKAIEKATGLRFQDLWVIRYDKFKAEYEICRVADRKQAWKEFIAISRAFDAKASRGFESLLVPLFEKEVIKI